MPVFECARCNNLTYSASRFASITCDVCGGARHRMLEHALSFDEAREEPREVAAGDHCCVGYEDAEQAAPLAAHVIRAGLADQALVVAQLAAPLEQAVR